MNSAQPYRSPYPALPEVLQSIEIDALRPAGSKATNSALSSQNNTAPSRPSSGVVLSQSVGPYSDVLLRRPSTPSDIDMENQSQPAMTASEKLRRAREEAVAKRRAAALDSTKSRSAPLVRLADQADTPSDPDLMQITPQDQISDIRGTTTVNAISTPTDSRSPSAIPPSHKLPSPPTVNQLLPLRDTNPEIVQDEIKPPQSPATSNDDDVETEVLQIPPLGQNHFVVPLPMVSRTRDVYESIIYNHKTDIEAFIGGESQISQETRLNMGELLDQLKKVCDNQDLIADDPLTQSEDRIQARYAEDISTKCMFLKEVLDALREKDEHIAVLVRPGKMMDIIEAILRTYDHDYVLDGADAAFTGKWPLKVSLVRTSARNGQVTLSAASIIIAFDSTFASQDLPAGLRSRSSRQNEPAPVIQLVVANSAEHIELCIQKTIDPLDRQLCLVSYVTQLRKAAGLLSHDRYPATEAYFHKERAGFDKATEDVAAYLADPNAEWPLLPMPDIKGVKSPLDIGPTQLAATSEEAPGSSTQSYNTSKHSSLPAVSSKRPSVSVSHPILFDFTNHRKTTLDTDEASTKRQRLTPAQEDRLEATHVSDTTNSGSESAQLASLNARVRLNKGHITAC